MKSDETYGAHMLVDFKPIEEADKLLEECELFMQQTKTALFTLPFVPSFSRVAAGVRSWRSKRRDNRLMVMYENIQPRVVATEKTLRKIIGEVVEKKAALRLQARHLHVRLEACIKHNKQLLAASDGPLEELRSIVNQLSGESTALKDMITFNKEVLRIRNVEEISKGQNFVRWGARPAAKKKNNAEADLRTDADHGAIEAKLVTIRELRERFVGCMAALLESRETQMNNLDNSDRSLAAVNSLIKRGGISNSNEVPSSSSSTSSTGQPFGGQGVDGEGVGVVAAADGDDTDVVTFDHSRCQDCSYAYSITCDCTNHFAALNKQAVEANQKLQALVEIREKMSEAYEQMCVEAGAMEPSKHGSFSSVRDPTIAVRPGSDSPQQLAAQCAVEATPVDAKMSSDDPGET